MNDLKRIFFPLVNNMTQVIKDLLFVLLLKFEVELGVRERGGSEKRILEAVSLPAGQKDTFRFSQFRSNLWTNWDKFCFRFCYILCTI